MNLREIQTILQENQPKLKLNSAAMPGGQQQISDYLRTQEAINALASIPVIRSQFGSVLNNPQFVHNTSDSMVIPNNVFGQLTEAISSAGIAVEMMKSMLNTILPPEAPLTMHIKLNRTNKINTITEDLSSLGKIFDQILLDSEIEGSYDIDHFESGSLWLTVVFSSLAAYTIIASIVWSAAVVRKKRIEGDLLSEQVREKKLRNDLVEELNKATAAELDIVIEAEAKNIMSKHKKKSENEYLERIKFSIREMASLILKGTEVRQAILPPEDVKNLIPDFKLLDSIDSQIKKLGPPK